MSEQAGVQITDEMIDAGIDAYYDLKFQEHPIFGISDEEFREGIRGIYLAMLMAPKKTPEIQAACESGLINSRPDTASAFQMHPLAQSQP